MDESQKHYAEQKKPHTKGYVFYDFIYINFQNKHNLSIVRQNQKSDSFEGYQNMD